MNFIKTYGFAGEDFRPRAGVFCSPFGWYNPAMPDYSNHQKKIIDRYYDQRDSIMLTKLQELVTELYLAETDKKRDQLWKRARTAMENLKIKPALIDHLVASRDPQLLAKNAQDWLRKQP
jgi:hypothetical protein